MSRLIFRDPFAREELHRETEYDPAATCPDCGGYRVTRNGQRYLYRYTVETDYGRKYTDLRAFCSVGCRRSFTGGAC